MFEIIYLFTFFQLTNTTFTGQSIKQCPQALITVFVRMAMQSVEMGAGGTCRPSRPKVLD